MVDLVTELLELEHTGWRSLCDGTGGDVYGALMTPDAHMLLADGTVMTRDDVVRSLEHAPPWASYTIDQPIAVRWSDDVAALIYTGTGHRNDNDGDSDDLTALMTSVYVRGASGWTLVHHQQTPIV